MSFVLRIAFLLLLQGVVVADSSPVQELPVQYRNPLKAMTERYYQPVNIRILPAWGLTEKQLKIASQPPVVVPDPRRVCFVYPEDIEPTPEQIAAGDALTPDQRKHMRRARRKAMREAVWRASVEAEVYNLSNSAALAALEKQGRYIVIKLSEQRGYYMEGEQELRSFPVCSGKKSTPTPQGHFHVQEKQKEHRSNLYNNANMPFFMRLTLDGVGLHQGPVRKYPASHGCIRLPREDAVYLFENCEVGTPVFIVD